MLLFQTAENYSDPANFCVFEALIVKSNVNFLSWMQLITQHLNLISPCSFNFILMMCIMS